MQTLKTHDMNCDILKIVRGNDFATQMTITALDAAGNVIEDFSLEDSTDVVVKYTLAGQSHNIEAYDYEIEGNDITIQWSDLALGKYGFEIEGKFNGYSWRSAARFIFQIVADNQSANIPDGVLVDGVYKLSDWLRLLSGTGGGGKQVQADWSETDTSSPAYIQNKPNLAPVATSGSYNDLTDKPTIPVVNGKADKVSGAVSGDFAALDANGNLTDSGKKASDFATAAQGAKADTAIQDISGKQDVLVSGTNIKTINNESILGSGNITIEGGGAVDSVNGKTGVVVLDAEDVGAYEKPSGGIPATDLASNVQTSLGKADTAIQEIKTINGNSLVGSGNINVSATEANVINSLTTGGATDALSAEQGKVLKESIDGLQINVKDRYSLLEGYTYEMNKQFKNDGTLQDATSGLGIRVFDYVPVVAGTYICCCRSYCTYDNNKNTITCDITGQNTYGKLYTITMPQNGYIRICAAASSEYIRLCLESEKYKTRADYHGIQNLYNPIISPCNVVLLGDSNTYGYGLSDRTKAWSGFYKSAITNLPQNVYCDAKLFCGYFVSQSYSGKLKMGNYGKIYFKVYTDYLSLKFEYPTTINITIDGVAQTAITSSNQSYELTEGLHEVVLEATSGNNNVFWGYTYHQVRTCVNNAVTGTNSSSLGTVDISSGNLFVVMFGTNDRSLDYGDTISNLSSFISKCKDAGKKVILLTPIPPLKESDSTYKINIGQVVSQFANDIKPLVKYIDTYSVMEMYYLIYTRLHNTAIYSDDLHLNALGHRLLWSAIAPKLGFAMHISDLVAE